VHLHQFRYWYTCQSLDGSQNDANFEPDKADAADQQESDDEMEGEADAEVEGVEGVDEVRGAAGGDGEKLTCLKAKSKGIMVCYFLFMLSFSCNSCLHQIGKVPPAKRGGQHANTRKPTHSQKASKATGKSKAAQSLTEKSKRKKWKIDETTSVDADDEAVSHPTNLDGLAETDFMVHIVFHFIPFWLWLSDCGSSEHTTTL